jgi:hypothetical protein
MALPGRYRRHHGTACVSERTSATREINVRLAYARGSVLLGSQVFHGLFAGRRPIETGHLAMLEQTAKVAAVIDQAARGSLNK